MEGANVVGLDYSDEVVNQAEILAKEKGLQGVVSFKTGDVFNLPFENGTFDIGGSVA
jgi:ubiquinone/menaquinone biosynthesis C-methylase UbiE